MPARGWSLVAHIRGIDCCASFRVAEVDTRYVSTWIRFRSRNDFSLESSVIHFTRQRWIHSIFQFQLLHLVFEIIFSQINCGTFRETKVDTQCTFQFGLLHLIFQTSCSQINSGTFREIEVNTFYISFWIASFRFLNKFFLHAIFVFLVCIVTMSVRFEKHRWLNFSWKYT